MSGFSKLGYNVSPEQQSLLRNHNFSIRPLGTVGHLSLWRVLLLSWQPVLAFWFAALILVWSLRSSSEALCLAIYALGVLVLLAYPMVTSGALAVGVVKAGVRSKVRWSAVLYWAWWPVSKLALCCLAVALGTTLGDRVHSQHFAPYEELHRLQAYQQADPRASGARLQDAGVVLFNASAEVARLGAGCHRSGDVHCVAPILGAGPGERQELFMAGVDCCACPGEFRCGDWSKPASLGGMRVVDAHDNELYRLAAEDWSAGHGVGLGPHPLFFRWVANPLEELRELQTQGRRLLCLGLLAGPCLLLALAAGCNGLLGLLEDMGWAVPLELPGPPGPRARPRQGEGGVGEAPTHASDPKYVCL